MLKNVLSLLLVALSLQTARAAGSDTLRVYLKNSGEKVTVKDSADFYRIILPPDTNADKDLYRVFEYYPNGKLKSLATSLTNTNKLVLDGTSISYFPNGKRKSTYQFKSGRQVGLATNYYPNGKLYSIIKIDQLNSFYFNWYYSGSPYFGPYKTELVEMRDSTGKLLASNGNGHIIDFDENFKTIMAEGDLKKNKKEGEWRGPIADSGAFICVFHKDEIQSGISYLKSGKRYKFKQIDVKAVFSDGEEAFFSFMKKNVHYPESARSRKIRGQVLVGFYVEPNGTVSDVKVVSGLMKSMDDEAVRVINFSPLWIPAYSFGIPVRSYIKIGVYFSDI